MKSKILTSSWGGKNKLPNTFAEKGVGIEVNNMETLIVIGIVGGGVILMGIVALLIPDKS
ncbi:MAG: hypothetical protein LBT94_07150 [Prevotellaceae bacterium]|nr:hypothetical protein [Prevotellaceae bacterium]